MIKDFALIRRKTRDKEETEAFLNDMTERTAEGFSLESAGMMHDGYIAWAIMSRPIDERKTPKDEAAELLEAARKIARICKDRVDCSGCPFANEATQCRITNGIGMHFVPESWPIIREG